MRLRVLSNTKLEPGMRRFAYRFSHIYTDRTCVRSHTYTSADMITLACTHRYMHTHDRHRNIQEEGTERHDCTTALMLYIQRSSFDATSYGCSR